MKQHTECRESTLEVIEYQGGIRKRRRPKDEDLGRPKLARTVSDNETDDHDIEVDQTVSSSQSEEKKSRQSFQMTTKISWVKEYQSCPKGTNMRYWLKRKNESENTKVSYTSFRRWVMNLQSMPNKELESLLRVRSKKKIIRPQNEMEEVLIEFLRIRNCRLQASGKPKSSPSYIRAKAKEFYEEMYGEKSSAEFNASTSWFGHFQDSYKHLFELKFALTDIDSMPADQVSTEETETISLSDSVVSDQVEALPLVKNNANEKCLTLRDIEFLQQLMSEPSDTYFS